MTDTTNDCSQTITETERRTDISRKKAYTLYVINIFSLSSQDKPCCCILRRYSQLLQLHQYLFTSYNDAIRGKPFPERTYVPEKLTSILASATQKAELVEYRKVLLQAYIQFVINNETIRFDPKVKDLFFTRISLWYDYGRYCFYHELHQIFAGDVIKKKPQQVQREEETKAQDGSVKIKVRNASDGTQKRLTVDKTISFDEFLLLIRKKLSIPPEISIKNVRSEEGDSFDCTADLAELVDGDVITLNFHWLEAIKHSTWVFSLQVCSKKGF